MSPVTTRAAEKADQVAHGAAQILEGQVPNDNPDDAMGHPLHPDTVHWPIAVSLVELAAVNWWVSEVCGTLTIRWHGFKYPSLALPTPNVLLSAIALPGLLYCRCRVRPVADVTAAMLGGRMVYEYGVGVQRQGQGKQVKDKSE